MWIKTNAAESCVDNSVRFKLIPVRPISVRICAAPLFIKPMLINRLAFKLILNCSTQKPIYIFPLHINPIRIKSV